MRFHGDVNLRFSAHKAKKKLAGGSDHTTRDKFSIAMGENTVHTPLISEFKIWGELFNGQNLWSVALKSDH